ncbi:hypothetical protein TNCV_1475441 [Trichonephila clavipes]|nr:hypothetical protein TNCV_1475441 [Trichonephila clavipes]
MQGLLTTDVVILNHGQETKMTPELVPLSPNYHIMPTQCLEKRSPVFKRALDLLQNVSSESSDALTDDSSDEEVPASYLLEFSLGF